MYSNLTNAATILIVLLGVLEGMFIEDTSFGNDESSLTILSQSQNISVHSNETVQLPCLIFKQAPNTVVIWNQCEDPDCNQVRNPLTINKDNFIQDLRFRVLFENIKQTSKTIETYENSSRNNSISLSNESRLNQRSAELLNDDSTTKSDINKWTLEIRKFSKKDEGCYQCQLSSFQTKTIYYCINIQKKVFVSPAKLTVQIGEKISLKCSTEENVRMSTIKWYRNGHKLTENARITIEKHAADDLMHSYLIINESTMNDAGIYSCKFDKLHGRIHVDIIVADERKQVVKSSLPRSNPESAESYFSANSLFAFSSATKCYFFKEAGTNLIAFFLIYMSYLNFIS